MLWFFCINSLKNPSVGKKLNKYTKNTPLWWNKDEYRNAQAANNFAPLPPELIAISDGVHKLVQGIFDEKVLDDTEEVCVYAKLPKGFHIPTPVGNYSPDWAIAFYEGAVKYIYFVAETKGSEEHRDPIEQAKNTCAQKLFAKLNNGAVHYGVVSSYQHLMDIISN